MKAHFLLAFLIVSCVSYVAATHGDLCRVLPDGTQFRRPETCNEYVQCTSNHTALFYYCINPSMYDRNKYQCVEAAGDCEKNHCEGVNGKWVANPNNCNGFFYCANSVPYAGYCEPGFHFDASKQLCVFESNSDCFEVSNICEFLPDKTKFRNEKNCATYFQCSNGKKTEVKCASNKFFDVQRGACFDKTITPCTAIAKPKDVCGTAKKPSHGYKNDGLTCRGFFYCQNLGIVQDMDPQWGQCPEGLFFDAKSQTCTNPLNAVCKHNRCDTRGTMLVQSSGKNCREYIVCENGIPVEQRTCSGDKFFDEKRQACVNDIISYPCCDKQT